MSGQADKLRDLVAQVASAYFSNSHVGAGEIPQVISQIAASLTAVGEPTAHEEPAAEKVAKATPSQVRKSIRPDALISFEDGRSYKTLRRHLTTRGLSPEQYREKWGLPSDYPLTAPNYSAMRSDMAKNLGLGQMRKKAVAAKAAKPSQRGRRAKQSVDA